MKHQKRIIPVVTFLTPQFEYSSDLKGRQAMLSQCVFVLKVRIKQVFHPFGPHEISVLIEFTSGHLRHH